MFDVIWLLLWTVFKILAIALPIMGGVAYLTLAERKVIGYAQYRIGPNRVGWRGLLQPLADGLKLVSKEIIFPEKSNAWLFIVAPVMAFVPALVAWAVVPFGDGLVLADVDVGVLFLFALTSLAEYGVLMAGWASNSKYGLLGSMRACAQMISYEIAMGFALVGVIMAAGSLKLSTIVAHQAGGVAHWYVWPLFPLFIVYWIAGVAETNRAPFDVAEGESEIVAGFHVEYAGMAFALFFLAEYANMMLVSVLGATMFLGGWHSLFEGVPMFESLFSGVPGVVWLLLKSGMFLFAYLWFRATFPRYRYDQIMQLGWKVLIPVTLLWLPITGCLVRGGYL